MGHMVLSGSDNREKKLTRCSALFYQIFVIAKPLLKIIFYTNGITRN
jgi:hypothetical protein